MVSKTLLIVALLGLSGVVRSDDDAAKGAAEMTEKTFNEKVDAKPHFVMFYAPWCGHCKNLKPTYDEVADKYNEDEEAGVVVTKVDCTVETALCSAQDVTGYPTLKFFKSGKDSGVKYRGQRDKDSLVKYIEKQMGRITEEETKEPEDAKLENGLYILSEASFAKHIATGEHFIKFYAPWCGHCKKLAPTWDDLAKQISEDKTVSAKIGKIDCTQSQSVCQSNEVKGYPTLAYFKNGQKVETYSGARSLKELKEYVKSMSEVVKVDKDAVPTEDAKEHVVMADADNFKDTIKSGLTFVKFFAPWCGHCKKLAPTWEDLAAKYADEDDVKIAKVDCTSNDNKNKELCNEQGVNGFPTLNIYRDGEKIAEYSGKRGLPELQEFVKKHSSAAPKDEL